ncbi:MAG: hypothetical protein KGM83_11260 [Betaproteobacteria bacterium]|nr:hypothetical protein [Betaproteobacteria bacterium]
MGSNLPEYVVRPGEPSRKPPFACVGMQLYGFYVEGDQKTIQEKLVDPVLNAPRGAKHAQYRSFTDFILVTYSITAKCESTRMPDRDYGYVPEYCWTVWVPLLLVKEELGLHVAQQLVMYPAFIEVDNEWSLVAGREVYGFPKNQGPITIPLPDEDPALFSNASLVFKKYGADTRAQTAELMRIERTRKLSTAAEAWEDLEDAIKAVAGFLHQSDGLPVPGFDLIVDLLLLARHREVPAVFLKQFRDAIDGTRACYQAVIGAGCEVTGFHGGGLLDGEYTLTTTDYDSIPIASSLGLDPAGVPCRFPFWANIDFIVEDVTEVWKAG